MADIRKKVPESAEGEFFVDTTCIDCDTCRQLAPGVFGETGEYSFVHHQPENEEQTRWATRALLCCPTGSIGTLGTNRAREVMQDFPLQLSGPVYYNGFNSPDSYGGNSYFIRHPDGNWMIDSPKYLPHLVRRFEEMGGIRYIFLTHRDDVADAEDYARRFGAQRIIHRQELSAQPGAEIVIDGHEPIAFADGFKIIPTPGHTRGHMVLLADNRFLFTGDHLWWRPENQELGASRSFCWYSWKEQTASMERLLPETFEWVLPGHGDRIQLPAPQMHEQLGGLIKRMTA